MKSRPRVLILIAILEALAPLASLWIGAILCGSTFYIYARTLYRLGKYHFIFGFLGSQWAMAYGVYKVKPWSIPLCIAVCLWNILNTRNDSGRPTSGWALAIFIACHLLNLGVILYFLIPRVREIYFNKRLRWWESKARYGVRTEAKGSIGEQSFTCIVSEISVHGAFIMPEGQVALPLASQLTLKLEVRGAALELKGRVGHSIVLGGPEERTVAVRFYGLGIADRQRLRRVLKTLEADPSVPRKPERVVHTESFVDWLKLFLKSGRGWIPTDEEEPRRPAVAASEAADERRAA